MKDLNLPIPAFGPGIVGTHKSGFTHTNTIADGVQLTSTQGRGAINSSHLDHTVHSYVFHAINKVRHYNFKCLLFLTDDCTTAIIERRRLSPYISVNPHEIDVLYLGIK